MGKTALVIGMGLWVQVPQQEPAWQRFVPADSSFAVSLPGEPEGSTRFIASAYGLLPSHSVSTASLEQGQFLVSWTEYPVGAFDTPPAASVFEAARTAVLQSKGEDAVVLHRAALPAGAIGLATVFRTGQGRIVSLEFRWERGRFYQLMAETPDQPEAKAAAERFLRSFELRHRRRL